LTTRLLEQTQNSEEADWRSFAEIVGTDRH
jgi:hypothetical protein